MEKMALKKCKVCLLELEITNFYENNNKSKKGKIYYSNSCNKCIYKKRKNKQVEYYDRNRDLLNEKRKIYKEKNKERLFTRNQELYEKNILTLKIKFSNQWCKKKGVEGTLVKEDVEKIFVKQKNRCYYCWNLLIGKDFQIDHYIPISKGGLNLVENIKISCKFCNMAKLNHDPTEFTQWLTSVVKNLSFSKKRSKNLYLFNPDNVNFS